MKLFLKHTLRWQSALLCSLNETIDQVNYSTTKVTIDFFFFFLDDFILLL